MGQPHPQPSATPTDAAGAAPDARTPQPGRRYAPARGFTYRREPFGGILYHYEGIQPDPRVTFVDNAFLIDLLDAVQAHPHLPLSELSDAVQARFGLGPAERERMDSFFGTLIARGALVPE